MSQQMTGTRDTTYDLVSIMYHSLQGAETYHTYAHDAESAGDKELAGFFHEAQQQNQQLASKAKELLGSRMSKSGTRS